MEFMNRLGVTKEQFKKIYDENGGFKESGPDNKDTSTNPNGDYLSFIHSGAKKLNEENSEFVGSIISN